MSLVKNQIGCLYLKVWDGPKPKTGDFGQFFDQKIGFFSGCFSVPFLCIFLGTFFRQKSIFPWDLDDVFIVASIPSRRGDQLLHCEVAGKRGIFGLFSLFFYKFRWVNKMPSALYFSIIYFIEYSEATSGS